MPSVVEGMLLEMEVLIAYIKEIAETPGNSLKGREQNKIGGSSTA